MLNKTIAILEREGKIRRQKSGIVQVEALLKKVLNEVKSQNPQLELEFDLDMK